MERWGWCLGIVRVCVLAVQGTPYLTKKDFANMIKSRILSMGNYSGISEWPLNAVAYVLIVKSS